MALAEIFHSSRLADCEQRAFVLRAVGIEHAVHAYDDLFSLLVPEEVASNAMEHLRIYDAESRVVEPTVASLPLHGNAWIGSAIYIAMLISVAYFAGEKAGGFDWLGAGALRGDVTQTGEWWRVVTALTLHADVGHLLSNIAFGAPFGFFAAQLLGSARAWASILLAAALGNFLDSALMPIQQSTIGASTAVFAMLGLVAAYAWRRKAGDSNRWAHRWAPLIAGVALLGLTGSGGEHTDVLAHLMGFVAGALLGIAHAQARSIAFESGRTRLIAAVGSITAVIGAWTVALSYALR